MASDSLAVLNVPATIAEVSRSKPTTTVGLPKLPRRHYTHAIFLASLRGTPLAFMTLDKPPLLRYFASSSITTCPHYFSALVFLVSKHAKKQTSSANHHTRDTSIIRYRVYYVRIKYMAWQAWLEERGEVCDRMNLNDERFHITL